MLSTGIAYLTNRGLYAQDYNTLPPDAALVGYTFVRHIGLIPDELSSQGLEPWVDEHRRWHWRWVGSAAQSERGF